MNISYLFGAGVLTSLTIAVAHADLPGEDPPPPLNSIGVLCDCLDDNRSAPVDLGADYIVDATNSDEAKQECNEYWDNWAEAYTLAGFNFTWKTKTVQQTAETNKWLCTGTLKMSDDIAATFTPPTTGDEACNALESTNPNGEMPQWDSCVPVDFD